MGNDNLMKSGIIGEFLVWISNKIKNQVRLANRQVGVQRSGAAEFKPQQPL